MHASDGMEAQPMNDSPLKQTGPAARHEKYEFLIETAQKLPQISKVMEGCSWLGLRTDPARNRAAIGRFNADGAGVQAWVIPTDEERMIARHTAALLGLGVHGEAPVETGAAF